MGHRVIIDGVERNIIGGKRLYEGTEYNFDDGIFLQDGVQRTIPFTFKGETTFDWGSEERYDIADATWWRRMKAYLQGHSAPMSWIGKTKWVELQKSVLGVKAHQVVCIGVNLDAPNTAAFQTLNTLVTPVAYDNYSWAAGDPSWNIQTPLSTTMAEQARDYTENCGLLNDLDSEGHYLTDEDGVLIIDASGRVSPYFTVEGEITNTMCDVYNGTACYQYLKNFPAPDCIRPVLKGNFFAHHSGAAIYPAIRYYDQYVWIPSEGEIGWLRGMAAWPYNKWTPTFGECTYGKVFSYTWFDDVNNQVKDRPYWLRSEANDDKVGSGLRYQCDAYAHGTTLGYKTFYDKCYVAPCFVIGTLPNNYIIRRSIQNPILVYGSERIV